MTTNTPELRGCPFCGGAGKLFNSGEMCTSTVEDRWCVSCSNEGCTIFTLGVHDTRFDAIAKWNHRAGETTWQPIIEPLPYGNYIVTNNPHARTNDPNIMSHCWHTNMVHWDKEAKEFTCFYGLNMAKVHGLKMFMPVPLPLPPTGENK